MAYQSDILIAQTKNLIHIREIAKKLQIAEDDLEMYGKYKAKLPLSLIDDDKVVIKDEPKEEESVNEEIPF